MKPSIKKITPFDAEFDHEIEFSWNGNRCYSNKIVIYDAETLAEVFNDKTPNNYYSLSHLIPSGTLTNGKRYIVQCSVFDHENIESDVSDKYYFYVFSDPTFTFNVKDGDTITSPSVETKVTYFQREYEDINMYRFYLYNSTKSLIFSSNEMYDRNALNYMYKGLENNTLYYVRCIGATVNGIPLDTGYISFFVSYENANVYARFFAENDSQNGGIKYKTNFLIVQYNGKETFEYVDGKINLKNKSLYYDEGFKIDKDFKVIIVGDNFYNNDSVIFSAKNEIYKITLKSYIYDDLSLRFRLEVQNGLDEYLLYSDHQNILSNTKLKITIMRKDDLYGLDIEEVQ